MQTEQHILASQRFLDDALALESVASHMGAAEMIWGATIQALEALGHITTGTSTGHLSSNGRRRLAASVVSEGLRRYYRIQRELHGHFYKGHLSLEAWAEEMRQGRDCVGELLAVALPAISE